MHLDQTLINLLNGASSGLLLFMLSAGLTLIFSMMGVLNFAHAAFYMLGAYVAFSLSRLTGFWPALVLAPVLVGALGALVERGLLRRVHAAGQMAELLVTFGLSYVMVELVQVLWGRAAVPFAPPESLSGPAFTLVHDARHGLSLAWGRAPDAVCRASGASCSPFPATRAFAMLVALLMLAGLGLLLQFTRVGLVIRAALTHPQMVEALGHNVPRVFTGVFGGGCALAALAGVVAGVSLVTEPSMAALVGTSIFVVVVVGGLGSLSGAFAAALLVGLLQNLSLLSDASLASLATRAGWPVGPDTPGYPLWRISCAQAAPVLPYLLLVLVMLVRPKGLFGVREG